MWLAKNLKDACYLCWWMLSLFAIVSHCYRKQQLRQVFLFYCSGQRHPAWSRGHEKKGLTIVGCFSPDLIVYWSLYPAQPLDGLHLTLWSPRVFAWRLEASVAAMMRIQWYSDRGIGPAAIGCLPAPLIPRHGICESDRSQTAPGLWARHSALAYMARDVLRTSETAVWPAGRPAGSRLGEALTAAAAAAVSR
jgi:hypothetical protein